MIPDDLIPFSRYELWQIAIIHGAVALGFFIRGAFGFGSNLPLVLITTWIVGPHHAIVLTLVISAFAQIHLAPQGVRTADWSVFRTLIVGFLLGSVGGVLVFATLNADWLTITMALLIVAILIMDYYNTFARLQQFMDLRSRRVAIPLATLSGLVGSVSGGGGLYLLVAYLKLACANARALRGTTMMLSVVFQMARFVALAVAGYISLNILIESLSVMPAMLAGAVAGKRLFDRLSEARFFRAIQAVLLLGAGLLLIKGLFQILA
jgi:uncharacterized membrane protein YfcA